MQLWEMEDKENYEIDKEKLQKLTEYRINKLHMGFLNTYDEPLSIDDLCLIKKVFYFIKQNT